MGLKFKKTMLRSKLMRKKKKNLRKKLSKKPFTIYLRLSFVSKDPSWSYASNRAFIAEDDARMTLNLLMVVF